MMGDSIGVGPQPFAKATDREQVSLEHQRLTAGKLANTG